MAIYLIAILFIHIHLTMWEFHMRYILYFDYHFQRYLIERYNDIARNIINERTNHNSWYYPSN